MTWSAVLEALRVWVATASGTTTIFWQQEGARPASPYITIRVTLRRTGQDWLDVEDAVAPVEGAEIVHYARGTRELAVTLQAYGGSAVGASAPAALLDLVQAKAILPTARDALNAAGIGLGTFGPIQVVDILRNGDVLEPRAVMEVRGFVASEVFETGTFIETVEAEGTVS